MQNSDIRIRIAEIVRSSKEGHIPSSYSVVDIISILYRQFLRFDSGNPHSSSRDYFVLSKGHAAAALFAVMESVGLISREVVDRYALTGSQLGGHPDRTKVAFVEASTGSLGHGLPMAVGMAIGLKIKGKTNRVVVLIGDGESQEGTTWEAALVAPNRNLGNLCVVVDWNQSGMQLNPIDNPVEKWRAFGWDVLEVDGHSETDLGSAFESFFKSAKSRPTALVARTVKGKGVSFLEGHGSWHHKIPSDAEIQQIREELDA